MDGGWEGGAGREGTCVFATLRHVCAPVRFKQWLGSSGADCSSAHSSSPALRRNHLSRYVSGLGGVSAQEVTLWRKDLQQGARDLRLRLRLR